MILPAAAPFPALARRQALLAGVAAAVGQISRAARLRHRVHYPGAGHRVDESGLLAACNTQGGKIQTSVSALDRSDCGGEITAAKFLTSPCPQCELDIVFTLY
jgi:hypothetical protein